MTEKRFKMKKLEYESYFIDSQQEYVDEDEPNFKIDGEKTLSDSQILDLLNENEQLKQSIKEIDEAESHLKQIILKRIDDYIWEWEDEGTPVAQVLRELRDEIKGDVE